MATGEMSIHYHGYASQKAANALESSYISKGELYNTIAVYINQARAYGATYTCTYLAAQDMTQNSSAAKAKAERTAAFAFAIENFMETVEKTDCDVAILFGKNYSMNVTVSFFNQCVEHIVAGLDFPGLAKEALDEIEILPAGTGGIIKYFLSGEYDDKSTTKAFVSFYADVFEEYEDVILPGSGIVFKSVANATSAIYHNWDEYANGEIGFNRMLVESASEAVFDIGKDAILEGAFVAAFGPAGLITAPIASWGLDQISKTINGKDFAENVGDLAGGLYDLAVDANDALIDFSIDAAHAIGDGLGAVGDTIGDGLETVGNVIGDGLDAIGDGLYVIGSSVASWWPW